MLPVIQSLLPPTAMMFLELPLKQIFKKKFLSKLVYKNGPLFMLPTPTDTIKSLSLSNSLTEKKCSLYKLNISIPNTTPYISEKINGTLHSMVKLKVSLFHSVMEPTETMLSKTCTKMTQLPPLDGKKLIKLFVTLIVLLVKPEPPICVSPVHPTELMPQLVIVTKDTMK